jgi:hypothetical protein
MPISPSFSAWAVAPDLSSRLTRVAVSAGTHVVSVTSVGQSLVWRGSDGRLYWHLHIVREFEEPASSGESGGEGAADGGWGLAGAGGGAGAGAGMV